MKALSCFFLSLAICVATVIPSSADDDRQLFNVRGQVTDQPASGPPKTVALNAQIGIADNDTAVTGANSQAKILLPNSSTVLVGQNTTLKMSSFSNTDVTSANFLLVNGKVRFQVNHPNGAKANYTFATSTGQIAVRGTEGDISASDTQLQVNVYQLTDQKLPVVVTLNNGKTYTLFAGQTLLVGVAAGAAIASSTVTSVSQTLTKPFSEFGPAQTATVAAAAVAPAALAIAAGAAVAGAVIVGSTHTSPKSGPTTSPVNTPTPTPPPSPTPSPTPTPTPTPTPGAVTAKPDPIAFKQTPGTITLKASQSNGSGQFTATSTSANISLIQTAPNTFTVNAKAPVVPPGSASITITGDGGQSVTVPVSAASGTVTYNGQPLAVSVGGTPAQFSVSEQGYAGTFTATASNANVSISAGGSSGRSHAATSSGTFLVTGQTFGSATITVNDQNGHTLSPSIAVSVASGSITAKPSQLTITKFNSPTPFTASEDGFTGTFTALSDKKSVASVTPSSSMLFNVTAVANGSATITVSDGLGNNTEVHVTVNTPSPEPSTTCVPIIIQEPHAKGHRPGPAGATPCPSSSPSSSAPAPRRTTGPPKPHPLGPPPPFATPLPQFATPPPHKVEPAKTPQPAQPHPPMQPMQPMGGMPGGQTPPPLPPPPPGNGR